MVGYQLGSTDSFAVDSHNRQSIIVISMALAVGVGTGWSGGAIAPPLLEGNGDLKGVAYFSISLSPSSTPT